MDPDAPENRHDLNIMFFSQSSPGIRKKLQRLGGLEGNACSELVGTAQKGFNNKECPWNLNILKVPSPKDQVPS